MLILVCFAAIPFVMIAIICVAAVRKVEGGEYARRRFNGFELAPLKRTSPKPVLAVAKVMGPFGFVIFMAVYKGGLSGLQCGLLVSIALVLGGFVYRAAGRRHSREPESG